MSFCAQGCAELKNSVKAVVFDLDNTLTHRIGALTELNCLIRQSPKN